MSKFVVLLNYPFEWHVISSRMLDAPFLGPDLEGDLDLDFEGVAFYYGLDNAIALFGNVSNSSVDVMNTTASDSGRRVLNSNCYGEGICRYAKWKCFPTFVWTQHS